MALSPLILRPSPAPSVAFAMLLAWAATLPAAPAAAQPRFGIEAGAGQGLGLTSYIDDVTYLQGGVAVLGDEVPGSGLSMALSFVFTDLEVDLGITVFDRSRLEVHHCGAEARSLAECQGEGLGEDRVRPDGTVDDSGVVYHAIPPVEITVPDRTRGSLLVTTLGAGWRWGLVHTPDFDLYVPFAGALVATNVAEPTRPYVFGVEGRSGLGMSLALAAPIGLFARLGVHGLVTPSYTPLTDAARAAVAVGDSTEEAVLSSMLYGSAIVGLQFVIR